MRRSQYSKAWGKDVSSHQGSLHWDASQVMNTCIELLARAHMGESPEQRETGKGDELPGTRTIISSATERTLTMDALWPIASLFCSKVPKRSVQQNSGQTLQMGLSYQQ